MKQRSFDALLREHLSPGRVIKKLPQRTPIPFSRREVEKLKEVIRAGLVGRKVPF